MVYNESKEGYTTKRFNDEKLLLDDDLIENGQTVVLGLSGGPDSVCLLFELLELGHRRKENGGESNPIICAHINHGLRGEESDGDEAYVLSLCERLRVPVEVKRIDAAELAKEKGQTIEEIGREARYAFFDEICEKYENPIIAVAHNLDDHIETVFMRIMRGTGTDGLAGIKKSRKSAEGYEIVRPLLHVSSEDIRNRLLSYGEKAREDESNTDTKYFRNKISIEVLPLLEEKLGIQLKKSLLRLSENAAEDRDYFDAVVSEALDEFLESPEQTDNNDSQGICYLPTELLTSVHPAIRHRLIKEAFAELGLLSDIAAVHLSAADRLLSSWTEGREATGKRVEFPSDYTFGIEGKRVVFRSPDSLDPRWKPRRKL